jgi:hypothetical protein
MHVLGAALHCERRDGRLKTCPMKVEIIPQMICMAGNDGCKI